MALRLDISAEDAAGNPIAAGVIFKFETYIPKEGLSMQFGLYPYRSQADHDAGKQIVSLLYTDNSVSPPAIKKLPSNVNIKLNPCDETGLSYAGVHSILKTALEGYFGVGTISVV